MFVAYGQQLLLLFVVSHISVLVADQKKILYTVANPARGLLNREKKKKTKVWQRTPTPPRCSFGEYKIRITRRIYMPMRYAGLGPSRVRTRIPSRLAG